MNFHSIIYLPAHYRVLDLTQARRREGKRGEEPSFEGYCIGRYDELREQMYSDHQFGARCVHMGLDIGAPPGTPIFSFAEAVVDQRAYHSARGDYGYTLVLRYDGFSEPLFALYGHLSQDSFESLSIGQNVKKGATIGWLGGFEENGGWPCHLHFQLSWVRPENADLPGVVAQAERAQAKKLYPDPRWILGPIY